MTYKSPDREEIQKVILDRMMNGESMVRICNDEGMPSRMTVFNWLDEDPVFLDKYRRARGIQADYLHDTMTDIEENILDDKLKSDAGRVVLWSRQWRAARLSPRKYGEKHQIGGAEDLPAIKVEHDQNEAVRRIAFLLDKAGRDATG